MGFLNFVLPVLLYIFGIILLIVLIILVVRLIQVINKADRLIDDVQDKVSSLDTLFKMIDKTTDAVALITDKVVNVITGSITKIFKKKKKEEDDYE